VKFVNFLNQETNWNRAILEQISMFSFKPNQTIENIDSLIMTLTKIVEDKLRSTLARKLGRAVPRSKSFGIALLDYSVNSHLIANKDEAIYSLLKLILKDPRNTSHHTFRNYPYKTLVMFLSEINEA